MNNKYVFISYSHRNSAVVFSIVRHMQNDGYCCWMDRCLQGGTRWTEELARRINESTCCILFVSHSYIKSENCADEWNYAKKKGKIIIRVHLDDVEMPQGMDMALSRFQSLNYDGSNSFWKKLYESSGVCKCHYTGEEKSFQLSDLIQETRKVSFERPIQILIDWLTGLSPRWGALDSAKAPEHANTCEGLLAMKMSGFDVLKKSCYQRAWNYLMKEMTPNGLTSKSLGRETVVCTSMLLLLAAMERDSLNVEECAVFDKMATHLWETRNPENGWGVFVSAEEKENCSYANTAWALRALKEYPLICRSKEYLEFCQQIFETERDGTFSFFCGGQPKLIVTSMFMGLFYRMDSTWKINEGGSFNRVASIQFIYRQFVERNIQVEMETLYGVETEKAGPKKVPWNHITVWAALDALSQAYYAGDLHEEQWKRLIIHMERIVNENVRQVGNRFYYHPNDMEESRNGCFTFPTAYLIMGLSQMPVVDV